MLRPNHLDSRVIVQRHADGIAAHLQIVPQGPFQKAEVRGHFMNGRVADGFHHISHTVRQYQQKMRPLHNFVYAVHNGQRGVQQIFVLRQNAMERSLICLFSLPGPW